jgi:hypothetical protein
MIGNFRLGQVRPGSVRLGEMRSCYFVIGEVISG